MRGPASDTDRVRVWRRSRMLAVATVVVGGVAAAGCLVPVAGATEACANAAIRAEQGVSALALPECRAYEMVSALDAHPNVTNALPKIGAGQGASEAEAGAGGGILVYKSYYPPSGAPSLVETFAVERSALGWRTQSLGPSLGPEPLGACFEHRFFSASLLGEVVSTLPKGCQEDEPPVAAGEPGSAKNLLVRKEGSASYQLVDVTPEGVVPGNAVFQGASSDLGRVVFTDPAMLVPGVPSGSDLYIWDEGTVRLVTYLPVSGEAAAGALADGVSNNVGMGTAPAMVSHAVSSDGESVVFSANGDLFVREHASRPPSPISGGKCSEPALACTLQLDVAEAGAPGTSGSGVFQWGSVDGSRIFFTEESRITKDATSSGGKPDLYEYAVGSGKLTDLTVDASQPADVLAVAGASADGSYVYFVADGALPGSGRNSVGSTAQGGSPNLYVEHEGKDTFIATLSPEDHYDWGANSIGEAIEEQLTTVTARGGEVVAFNSVMPVTGYANAPAAPEDCLPSACNEIFEYDAGKNRVVCVSCGAPGTAPAGLAQLRSPAGTSLRRALMADGRVFFDTPSPLVQGVTNGVSDVYEWAPVGVAECGTGSATYSSRSGGCLYLISSGTSPEPSYFVDASETGEDVFFLTSQSLLSVDTDNGLSLYDARVGGGFPGIPGKTASPAGCGSVEGCRSPLSAPPSQTVGQSSVLLGPGNLVSSAGGEHGGGLGKRVKPKRLTRAQKLKRALRRCRAIRSRRRARRCEARARRRFQAHAKTNPRHRKARSGR